MKYCGLKNVFCSIVNDSGFCSKSVCVYQKLAEAYEWDHVHAKSMTGALTTYGKNEETLIFPHTIGSITFYTKKELIDWVLMQQDEDYGRGNNA